MAKVKNQQLPVALTVGDKGRITLSEPLRAHLQVEEGELLYAAITDHATIEIGRAALIPRDQAWFVHPSMQRRLAEAHADVVARRVTRVKTAKELRAHLTRLTKKSRSK